MENACSVKQKSRELCCSQGTTKEQPPVSAAASSSAGVFNKATVHSLLLAALKEFEDQVTDQMPLFALKAVVNLEF